VAIDYRRPGRAPQSRSPQGRLVTCVQATTSGSSYGSLTFRVGMADESVPTRGITHLVEHLVMRESHDVDVRSNASVGLTRTTFWASGEEADVITFLQRVQRALTDVPVQHLASERDLISVEEEHHTVSLPSPVQHFGTQRYGVVWFEQQLAHLSAEQLRSWVGTYFTAANAVLTLVGVDRGRAGIRLPDGRFFAEPPVHVANSGPTLHVDATERTISLTALLPRSWQTAVLVGVLDRAVMNRLRHVEHLAYGAGASELHINLDTTMVSITSDCIPGREAELVAALLDELSRLTVELPDDLVLRAVKRAVAEAENTSPLTEEALRVLYGRGVPASLDTMEHDLDQITVNSLQDHLREFLANCVLRTPVPVEPAGRWTVVGAPTGNLWSGRSFSDGARTLTIAGNGLQITGPGHDQQITWSSITAAFVTQDQWTLVSRKGVRVDVCPGEFSDHRALTEELADRVPTAVRLPGPWRKAKG